MSFSKNAYLNQVLQSYKMRHVEGLMEKYKKKREEIKDALTKKFGDKLATRAINSGSYAKHTAINRKFDIDLCQPFKKDSFSTLSEMADAVYDFFDSEYEDDQLVRYKTRKQRVSTGLTFNIDGDEIQMDVVPGRELIQDDYKDTHRINLFVKAKLLEPETSTQTNIQKHIDLISGKPSERNSIRLLKIWKTNKNKDRIKSFFVELLVIRAYENCQNMPSDVWGQLEKVLQFIRDNVTKIRVEDPANSNNVVSDTMTESEKQEFSDDTKHMLLRIEKDETNLKEYFAVNDDFIEEVEEAQKAAALEVSRSGPIRQPYAT